MQPCSPCPVAVALLNTPFSKVGNALQTFQMEMLEYLFPNHSELHCAYMATELTCRIVEHDVHIA